MLCVGKSESFVKIKWNWLILLVTSYPEIVDRRQTTRIQLCVCEYKTDFFRTSVLLWIDAQEPCINWMILCEWIILVRQTYFFYFLFAYSTEGSAVSFQFSISNSISILVLTKLCLLFLSLSHSRFTLSMSLFRIWKNIGNFPILSRNLKCVTQIYCVSNKKYNPFCRCSPWVESENFRYIHDNVGGLCCVQQRTTETPCSSIQFAI